MLLNGTFNSCDRPLKHQYLNITDSFAIMHLIYQLFYNKRGRLIRYKSKRLFQEHKEKKEKNCPNIRDVLKYHVIKPAEIFLFEILTF